MPFDFLFDKEKALETFSNGFEKFLHRKKIKPIDVAKEMNLTHAAPSAWKNGHGFPDFQTLSKLLEMGMTIDEIFGENFGEQIIKNSLDDYPQIKAEIIEKHLSENKNSVVEEITERAKINVDNIIKSIFENPEFIKGYNRTIAEIEKQKAQKNEKDNENK